MKISSVKEMRNMDRTAIQNYGIIEELLMENAGQAAYFVILKQMGVKDKKFVVLCGTGNNGGDGLVVARKIHSTGGEVRIFILDEEAKFKGSAGKNFEMISKLPVEIIMIKSKGALKALKADLSQCHAVVDALFGTGLSRNVEDLYQDVIKLVNKSGKMVFSLDIPSGINGNTGKIMGIAVSSDHTITFGLPKIGNLLYPGYEHCGKLYVSHISFPPSLYNSDSLKIEVNEPVKLCKRERKAHKGDFGHVLFIAGASNYYGAPYLSSYSFLKAGGGYSRLAAPASIIPLIASKGSEIVFMPQEETASGSIALKNMDRLLELSERVDMVVMGPGLSLNEETQELARRLTKEIKKPLLIDGDGITSICDNTGILAQRLKPTVLTPHAGEMSKITGAEAGRIEENPIEILQNEVKKLNAIIVLKGAHSLIGYPDGRVFINMSGNPGMATAGSGDVLTGAIAAMFGLGLSLEEAVKAGVFIHGVSGDLAAEDKGEDGITAQDILDYLPRSVKYYRDEYDEILKSSYKSISVV